MTTNKNNYIWSFAIVALLVVGSFKLPAHSPKCPDDFGKDDAGSAEYLAATNKWTNDFFDAHPDATMTDWANARHEFWVENHCTAALQRYEDIKAGKVDPQAKEAVDNAIREATATQ